eukprot:6195542-Pleurochrysis_carterae.AAC.1
MEYQNAQMIREDIIISKIRQANTTAICCRQDVCICNYNGILTAPHPSTPSTSFCAASPSRAAATSTAMRAVTPTVVAAAAAGLLSGIVVFVSWRRWFRRLSYEVVKIPQHTQLVVVVGVGGVGSHAAQLLLRGGISRLRLVDFDQLTLSSLNRHATGTRAAVGKPKVIALRDALLQICPSADIDARSSLFNLANASELLEGTPDLVVDAIDDLATKAELLEYCVQNGLPVISAMGAGGKADAAQLHLVRLSEVNADAIATTLMRNVRKTQESWKMPWQVMLIMRARVLHKVYGPVPNFVSCSAHAQEMTEPSSGTRESFASWPEKVVCVACSEKQRVGLLPLPEGVLKASELGVRTRLPSCTFYARATPAHYGHRVRPLSRIGIFHEHS